MKNKIMIPFLLLVVSNFLPAIDTYRETQTATPSKSRYEVITSPIAMNQTFLLDKFTGDTWQLVVDSDNFYTWQEIDKESHPTDFIPEDYNEAVYQITMSGIAVKGTYLINTLTGATWTMYRDSSTGLLFWGIVESPGME